MPMKLSEALKSQKTKPTETRRTSVSITESWNVAFRQRPNWRLMSPGAFGPVVLRSSISVIAMESEPDTSGPILEREVTFSYRTARSVGTFSGTKVIR